MPNQETQNASTLFTARCQMAVNLWCHTDDTICRLLNWLVAVNSILILSIIQIFVKKHGSYLLSFLPYLLSVFGIFICFVWYSLLGHNFNCKKDFAESALTLERTLDAEYNIQDTGLSPVRYQRIQRDRRLTDKHSVMPLRLATNCVLAAIIAIYAVFLALCFFYLPLF